MKFKIKDIKGKTLLAQRVVITDSTDFEEYLELKWDQDKDEIMIPECWANDEVKAIGHDADKLILYV